MNYNSSDPTKTYFITGVMVSLVPISPRNLNAGCDVFGIDNLIDYYHVN